ncbi:MAG: serine/threonine protein kinase [Myxococcaceae bacterium]|nr:serine/threonine protein kinase [Myxococcaceae bacterium]
MTDPNASLDDTVRRPNDPLIGQVVDGRFEVKQLLGRGGMGAVYLATQPSVGREVALKVLHGHFQRDDELVKRFEREIRLCAQLSHPNVVTVHDAGVWNGLLFMAMERLEGCSLAEVAASGPVEPARAARLVAQVCEALSRAHERGIVHRDVKASNVMVLQGDLVKVLDFGIATVQSGERLTATHGVLGSPNAIAPEVIRSAKNVTPKADLYAVGTLLYELLTGEPPFGTDTANAVFVRQLSTTPPALPPTVPPGLRALVCELIDPAPEKRPASADVVRQRLLAAQTLAEPSAGPLTERAASPRLRPRLALGATLAALGLSVTAGVLAWRAEREAGAPRPPAPEARDATPPPSTTARADTTTGGAPAPGPAAAATDAGAPDTAGPPGPLPDRGAPDTAATSSPAAPARTTGSDTPGPLSPAANGPRSTTRRSGAARPRPTSDYETE